MEVLYERAKKFQRSVIIMKIISVFFLFLFSVFTINAQPQSFFISPGQTIEDGNTVRGFCLEYTKDTLNDNNIGQLKKITGNVLVTFKDSTTRIMTFEDLYLKEKLIRINGYGSAQYIKVNLDNNIARVTVEGTEGIVLARENMNAADTDLIRDNVRLITDMLRNGASHQSAQNASWLNKAPSVVIDENAKTVTIDYHTSPEGKQLTGSYGDTAAVIFDHAAGTYRFDGMQMRPTTQAKALYDFITHFHGDHIDYRTLERALQDGLAGQVYFPLPMLDRSMRKKSFETMQSIVDSGKYEFDINNFVCEIQLAGKDINIPVKNSFIGQFLYSQYRVGDLTIETYRHINPKNENMDGIIYRVQYKNVSQLNLGDYDNEEQLADLLKCSEENQKKRLELLDEYYALEKQVYTGGGSEELKQRRDALYEQIQLLPTVRADIVKWPHHARIFKNIELAEQLNRVLNPRYFIYQAHHAQAVQKFETFIWRLSFREKFINSAKYRVDIISLIQLIKAYNNIT